MYNDIFLVIILFKCNKIDKKIGNQGFWDDRNEISEIKYERIKQQIMK